MLDYRTHTFLAACRLRSYTQAAEELHITQPAVSQHIRQLEHHYGCPLFARDGRAVRPTRAGELLYRRLSSMENDERRVRGELAALAAHPARREPLRLGCTRTVADHVAPRLLAAHLARHAQEPLLLHTGNTSSLVQGLEQGTLDIALVEGSFDHAIFESEALSHEPFSAIGPAGASRAASVRDLLGRTVIVREPGSGTREILEKHLAARDLALSSFAGSIELDSIPAIKACVAAGAGITFIYRIAVEQELETGVLADVTPPDFALEHDFSLIWQRGSLYERRYRGLLAEWRRENDGAGSSLHDSGTASDPTGRLQVDA